MGRRGVTCRCSNVMRRELRCSEVVRCRRCKAFYGQEPPSGESTTTECAVNYQLLTVMLEVPQWGAPSCNRPQEATDNGEQGEVK